MWISSWFFVLKPFIFCLWSLLLEVCRLLWVSFKYIVLQIISVQFPSSCLFCFLMYHWRVFTVHNPSCWQHRPRTIGNQQRRTVSHACLRGACLADVFLKKSAFSQVIVCIVMYLTIQVWTLFSDKTNTLLLFCTGWHKKCKPLPNDQKFVLNRIKACQWD